MVWARLGVTREADALRARAGFVMPMTMIIISVVTLVLGGVFAYVSQGTRSTGYYTTGTICRLAAQTVLEEVKADISMKFSANYEATQKNTIANILSWFPNDTTSQLQTMGSGTYCVSIPDSQEVNGCQVVCRVVEVDKDLVMKLVDVTLRATAKRLAPSGAVVQKTLEERVRYRLARADVFDYAYFVNNRGWFQGESCYANGDIRANGNMELDAGPVVNGDIFSSGYLSGLTGNFWTRSQYWSNAGTTARPTTPTWSNGSSWEMGYDASTSLYTDRRKKQDSEDGIEDLEMPYISDLSIYKAIAQEEHGKILQGSTVLIDAVFDGTGPSGVADAADKGCIILEGTSSSPIVLNGTVVVEGDVLIKGYVTGQGVIYAGRNIHILGDVRYKNPPSWPKPDNNPTATATANLSKDMLGLAAKGNIVIGNYTPTSTGWGTSNEWLEGIRSYITPSFVPAYTCDPSDVDIGYGTASNPTFSGDYTKNDGGEKVKITEKYLYNSRGRVIGTTNVVESVSRKYYESSVADSVIASKASNSASRIDAVLYNNHAIMGHIGACTFNGSLVCRDEALLYSGSLRINWDIRLGSRSADGMAFSIYLPLTLSPPKTLFWREVIGGHLL